MLISRCLNCGGALVIFDIVKRIATLYAELLLCFCPTELQICDVLLQTFVELTDNGIYTLETSKARMVESSVGTSTFAKRLCHL